MDITLGVTIEEMVRTDATFSASTIAAARQVAREYPLDPRPYLVLGRDAAGREEFALAVSLLEAGQRLNPRQRLINLFLLERYLLDGEYQKGIQQLSVLARLVGPANEAITQALVLMATDPETRPAVKRTLREDPRLERAVLAALAQGDVEPAQIFDLASPAAIAEAGTLDSWGPALARRLVENGRYGDARAIWHRIYRIEEPDASEPIYNRQFQAAPGSPPFNWSYTSGNLGVADPDSDGLFIDYYGRESGDLASQTLVLSPGRYRFAYKAEGGRETSGSRLLWQIICLGGDGNALVSLPVGTSRGPTTRGDEFTVPGNCPAQTLRLYGEAGEFPDEVRTTVQEIAISPMTGAS